jgi:uncharacterized peroxidase-related enzyme
MSYIRHDDLSEREYAPFASILEQVGFIPNFFRVQVGRKDLLEAQIGLIGTAMMQPGALERRQKEYIFLAVSARNLSTYCVTAHCEIVRMLKLDGPEPEQVAIDHTAARIPLRDKALINFAIQLSESPSKIEQSDVDKLRTFGFSDREIQEAIVTTAVARFANTVSFALGSVPDFHNERILEAFSTHAHRPG